jgi:twinkle protein
MGKTISRTRCPECAKIGKDTSGNNLTVYENKYGAYSKKCMNPDCVLHHTSNSIKEVQKEPTNEELITIGEYKDYRGISKEVCQSYGYRILNVNLEEITIGDCRIGKDVIAQKERRKNKIFPWRNHQRGLELFGRHLCHSTLMQSPLIITEGFEDAMSVYQATGIPTVSVLRGANSVELDIEDNRDFINSFDRIILFLDNDTEGQKAKQKFIDLLPMGKVWYVEHYNNYKDANDMLWDKENKCVRHDGINLICNAIYTAKEYTPPGLLSSKDLNDDLLLMDEPEGYSLPWDNLNKMVKGLRKGKFVLVGAGSNVGKTPVLREIGYHLYMNYPNIKIANFYLEETEKTAPLSYLALKHNVPVDDFVDNPLSHITKEEYLKDKEQLFNTDRLMFTSTQYDLTSKEFLNNLEYLAKVKHYDVIILDHISLLVDATISNEGERKDIDRLCRSISSLCKKTGLIVIAACHLSNPQQGIDWEEGREVRQKDFHGSSGLRKYPDIMAGVERNMKDPLKKDQSVLRIVKNRGRGAQVGVAENLIYKERTGRLVSRSDLFKD